MACLLALALSRAAHRTLGLLRTPTIGLPARPGSPSTCTPTARSLKDPDGCLACSAWLSAELHTERSVSDIFGRRPIAPIPTKSLLAEFTLYPDIFASKVHFGRRPFSSFSLCKQTCLALKSSPHQHIIFNNNFQPQIGTCLF